MGSINGRGAVPSSFLCSRSQTNMRADISRLHIPFFIYTFFVCLIPLRHFHNCSGSRSSCYLFIILFSRHIFISSCLCFLFFLYYNFRSHFLFTSFCNSPLSPSCFSLSCIHSNFFFFFPRHIIHQLVLMFSLVLYFNFPSSIIKPFASHPLISLL